MVGKRTPVWRNKTTGRVVCGQTIQEALGVGYLTPVSKDWIQVDELPNSKRVVIRKNSVLPENDLTTAIAEHAATVGPVTISAFGRDHKVKVLHVDSLRVIVQ